MGRNDITANTKSRDWRRLIPGLIISLISLAVVLYLAKPAELYKALLLADYRLVLVSIAVALLWLLVRSIAWRTLLQDQATLEQVFFTVNEGYLLNNVLPFRLGEIARSFLLSHKTGIDFWHVLSTIVIERIFDLALAAGLVLSTLPFVLNASFARQAALGAAGIVLLGLAGLFLLACHRDWAIARIEQLGKRWPKVMRYTGHSLNSFLSGLAVLTNGKLFFKALFWMTLDWLIAIGQYYLLVKAFIPEGTFLWAAFVLGIAALGIAAPSSPGGVGVYEAVVVAALAIFGVDAAPALAMAITAHLAQYLLVGVLGSIGLARDGQSLVGLYGRLRRISQENTP